MANKIVVFTLNGCGHCVDLKIKLQEQSVPFIEVEINDNKELWDQVVSQTGHNALPTVFVSLEEGDNGPVFIPERDFTDKDILVENLKKYL
jgi:glutaredoxin